MVAWSDVGRITKKLKSVVPVRRTRRKSKKKRKREKLKERRREKNKIG